MKHSKQRVRLQRQATAYARLAAKALHNGNEREFEWYSNTAARIRRQAERS